MAEGTCILEEPADPLPVLRGQQGSEPGRSDNFHPAHTIENDGPNLAALLRILWARIYWVLAASALGLALALIASLLQTPLYRSTAVLELNPPTVPILPGQSEQQDNLVVPNTDHEFLATQYGLLKSRTLAERVVQDLNLADRRQSEAGGDGQEARMRTLTDTLAENIEVKPVRVSRLVELSYSSENPDRAARIVNGFADAFLSSTLDRRFEATASARQFLKKRLETVRAKLDEAERKLVAYAKANNIIDTSREAEDKSEAGTLSGASLVALNEALALAQQKRIAAEQRYRQSGTITEVNQSTAALRQEKARLQSEYQEKSTTFQDDYPDMVRLRSRIRALDRAIRSEAESASGALFAEYRAALAEEGSLKARVGQLSAAVLDQRERAIQYNILQRELDTNRSLYDALLKRYNQVGVAGSVGTPQASIVDRGEIPVSPASPNIPLNLGLGLFFGLALGVIFVFGHEFLTDTITSPEDVREKLHLPALGVIPKKKRKEGLAEQLRDRKSPISEAYASLLTTLQFTTHTGLPKSVLVTSTRAGEGKSTSSFVLANHLAQLGKKVLLIDADMRRPSFVIKERAELGLSRMLVGDGSLWDHILGTHVENLWLMPSGPVPPNPAQLLNSPRIKAILTELTEHFDVVIVDAPPPHGFADAPLLASVCSSVLLIVESGKTRRRHALETIAKLQVSGSLMLGAALTKYESSIGEYGYGYYDSYRSVGGRQRTHELTFQLMGEDEG
ncbi:MAG: polysaccharide biosynthesis tyrosine autokinase [Novosphingobium sp.]|nr:polysaccharide biosynthesis tyrosine autokinase [Novosphingobium sp.]